MLTKIIKRFSFAATKQTAQAIIHISDAMIRYLTLPAGNNIAGLTLDTVTVENNQWQSALNSVLEVLPKKCQLHIVLSPDSYQIIQLDKPALPDDEMLQALPWLVKDLVEIAPEEMVVDYLELPEIIAQPKKINVVISRLSNLRELVQLIERQNKTLSSIKPEEWVLAGQLEQSAQPTMLVMHQPGQELLIQIVRAGTVYFSRRARGFNRLSEISAAELRNELLDTLLLELQRSMDYFESQLKQPPVRDIRLVVNQANTMIELLVVFLVILVKKILLQTLILKR
ncbi:hypothetical protein [Rheinheimera sp. MMS21-TC3]|uniref:hypothetical protein n=1 Tax=Rheinheimera sp. MMS21-TC3 TaxID=3072790 RepID=UPI0028C4E06F|nr:hypothetical protein [Rheinheimera sp. MMS21-TC3]WNO59908.1 hypothetical protein RDV63_02840 [Rheinheimera sp. MMS21-TC3]